MFQDSPGFNYVHAVDSVLPYRSDFQSTES